MKNTLNGLALATFLRKAKKLRATPIKCIHTEPDHQHVCTASEVVYVWNWEKGFLENTECAGITFGRVRMRLENTHPSIEFTHYALYNKELKTLEVYQQCHVIAVDVDENFVD